MKLLIGKSDFEGRIDLSTNLDAARKLNQHILHAQEFDFCGLVGDQFYYFFMDQFNSNGAPKETMPAGIRFLYEGGSYDLKGTPWNNPGIKPILVYFTGARLIKGIDQHITPNGYSTKVNEFSEPVSAGRKPFQANEYENQARSYWNKVETYLINHKILYPQYFTDCGCTSTRSRVRPRTIPVGNL